MFVTELPWDRFGNRGYTIGQPRVIEVEKEEGVFYTVISPNADEFSWRLITLYSWIEVEGPARVLTESEYVEVIKKAGASPELVDIARKLARTMER